MLLSEHLLLDMYIVFIGTKLYRLMQILVKSNDIPGNPSALRFSVLILKQDRVRVTSLACYRPVSLS